MVFCGVLWCLVPPAGASTISMLMCIQNLVKFSPFVLKILSGNEILRSIKGRNSVRNFRNLTLYNPNIDLINVNVYTKFG